MPNVWNAALGRWEDPEHGNALIGGAPGPNGTWAGGIWSNQQGGQFINGQWNRPDPGYNAQTQQFGAQQGVIDSRRGVLNANYGVNAAEAGQIPFRMATLNSNRGVLGATAATFGPKAGVIAANAGVVGAQTAQLAGSREFIAKQQAENATQKSEFETLTAAEQNVPDQTAVASFKRYRDAKDSRDRALGIQPSVEVNAAPGTLSLDGDLAPGVRAKATTQAEDVALTNKRNQTSRGFDLESAKLAVQLMGTDVDQARLVAAQAGLTLDQAQLGVAQAENAAGYTRNAEDVAGVGVTQARLASNLAGVDEYAAQTEMNQSDLNARLADRAPFPGAKQYTDPQTGQRSWMTPAEADQLEYQYSTQLGYSRIPEQASLANQRDHWGRVPATEAPTSVFDQYNVQQLLNLYIDPSQYTAPWSTTPRASAVEDALVKKLLKQGYPTEAHARSAAKQLIEIEMAQRAAEKAKSGRPTTQQDVP